jgi:hypothetical protein
LQQGFCCVDFARNGARSDVAPSHIEIKRLHVCRAPSPSIR